MNHKPSLTLLFLAFLLFSCNPKETKSDFIGIWESFEPKHTGTVMTFYYDSLVVDAFSGGYHTYSKWDFDSSHIYLNDITLIQPYTGDRNLLKDSLIYEYKFSSRRDTLGIMFSQNDSLIHSIFKKVDKNIFDK